MPKAYVHSAMAGSPPASPAELPSAKVVTSSKAVAQDTRAVPFWFLDLSTCDEFNNLGGVEPPSPPWRCAPSPFLALGPSPWANSNEENNLGNTPTFRRDPFSLFSSVFSSGETDAKPMNGSGRSTPTWCASDSTVPEVDPLDPKDKAAPALDGATVAKQMLAEQLSTVMLRNVHNRVCAKEFALKLDSLGFEKKYDLCLIPTDPHNGLGKGYGFVNFPHPAVAAHFCEIAETISFGRTGGKRLQVAVARLQGVELTMQNRTRKAKKKSRRGSIVCSASPQQ